MFIENPEAFKSWLTSILEPLCDADPAALAKYVYALVKKDKPPDELKEGMLDQLDVFLQHETKPFVDLLFKTLEKHENAGDTSGASVDSPAVAASANSATTAAIPVSSASTNVIPNTATLKQPVKAPVVVSQEDNMTATKVPTTTVVKNNNRVVLSRSTVPSGPVVSTANGSSANLSTSTSTSSTIVVTTTAPTTRTVRQHNYLTEQTLVKVVPDLLEQATAETTANQTRFKRDRERRRRSRSRSWERGGGSRRERLPVREGDRERGPVGIRRAWRNRSPPLAGTLHNPEYRRRAGSRSPSPIRPPTAPTGGRYRNRSPPGASDRPRSRSRSRTPPRRGREPRDGRESRRRSKDMSPHDRDSRDSPTNSMAPPRKRCRDFDEKGYCMRGDLCSWDHGVDPVVVEDAALSSVLALGEYNPLAPDIWREPPSASYPPPTTSLPPPPPSITPNVPPPLPPHHHMYPMTSNYHRMMVAGAGVQYGATPPPPPGAPPTSHNGVPGRSLIEIPRVPSPPRLQEPPPPPTMPHMHGALNPNMHQQGGFQPMPRWKRRGPFDYNRLPAPKPPVNSSLVLRRVPSGMNDITHLNSHFSKFGKIVNMQVNYERDPESALVTFSSHAEANTAYKSTEAVLNNRFIRVFWHNNSEEKNDVPGPAGTVDVKPPEVPGEGGSEAKDSKPASNSGSVASTTTTAPVSTFTPLNNTHNKVLVNKENIGRTAVANAAGAINKRKLAATVRARGQQLLHRQLQHQRLLIQRLESSKVTGPSREALLTAVKAAQDGIEKLRKELLSTGNTVATPAQAPLTQKVAAAAKVKSREDTQRELLDAELDLFNKQHEGSEDIVEIQHRMVELRRLQQQTEQQQRRRFGRLGGRGGISGTGLGRGALAGAGKCVDRRPRTFLVAGLTADESQNLTNLLTPLGALTTTTGGAEGSNTTNLVASFARRVTAEQSMGRIKNMFPNTTVTWLQQQQDNTAKKGLVDESSRASDILKKHKVSLVASSTNGATHPLPVLDDNDKLGGDDDDGRHISPEDEEALLMGSTMTTSLVAGDEEEEEPDEEEEERSWRR